MKQTDFVNMLKVAHDVPNYYNNHYPYNLGYYDLSRYSFDCWNLIKVILAGWQPTGIIGSYTKPTVTGDIDGAHLLASCYATSKDFTKISVPGTYLYISNSPHSGVYVGDFENDGYWFNVVECTGAWDNKVQYTYLDEKGNRYQYKGGPKNPYGWTDYGLLPWVEYETDVTPMSYSSKPNDINTTEIIDYTVQTGDSLQTIANKFGTTTEELNKFNGSIAPGKTIKVPMKTQQVSTSADKGEPVYHIVQQGEGLKYLATKYNTTPLKIKMLNLLKTKELLSPGRKIRVK